MNDANPGGSCREELRAWLRLLRTPGVGSRTFTRLLDTCGSPWEIVRLPRRELQALGLKGQSLDYLSTRDWSTVDQDLMWLEQSGNHLISLKDPSYPALLRHLADPPPVLFVRGQPEVLNNPQLAIVGTRNPSASGRETAWEFARYLAEAGLTVTSGLALGIDGSAHEGALAAGTTIAVTGTGLDRVYPARNRDLAHRIAERGALVSEFPPGTPPAPENFPRRNRIISGLSLGTLVVEAALRSGSLITARLAGEQGREIFAIPGSIHNPLARGCHSLIRQGAKLVETAADIIEELRALLGELASMAHESPAPPLCTGGLPDTEYQELLGQIGFDPVPIDLLIQRTGLTADAVSSMLLLLELEGHVTSLTGGRYCRSAKA